MRYTTYHGDVAVLEDKTQHKEAMDKLARYEDKQEKSARRVMIDQMLDELSEKRIGRIYYFLMGFTGRIVN